MKVPFTQNRNNNDWESYLGNEFPTKTRKQRLLEECNANDVSLHVDNANEVSDGIYSSMRGVASESELERRLMAKKTYIQSRTSQKIAMWALVISISSFSLALYIFFQKV